LRELDKGEVLIKKLYLVVIHILAVIGLPTAYLYAHAIFGTESLTVNTLANGCREITGQQIFSPEGRRAVHAKFVECDDADNRMEVWLQEDTRQMKYALVFDSVYNTDEDIEIKWDRSNNILITVPASVQVTSAYEGNQLGVSVYVQTK
ncbi:hypothetical protein OH458_21880, partial [Vibrio sp. MarTm2]|uniref:hypothetical protein n=1 Tax=Vibrio sp. MarTm2 TaxID=2998831 RepID=UPI0022CD98A8